MKRVDLSNMTVEELVARFEAITLAQDEALLDNDNARFTRLFHLMEDVKGNLKNRSGDQRRALMALYDHPNAQVRLKAAKATLAVAPEQARGLIEKIAASHEHPQAGEAGMSLWALDEGIFKPT
jgi:hypothetical protein